MNNKSNKVVVFLDLSDSTKVKQEKGHRFGVERILRFFNFSETIIKKNNGEIIKYLGDAILFIHDNPIDAINICSEIITKKNNKDLNIYNIDIKISITMGMIEKISIGSQNDIAGEIIDKCARLNSITKRNQVLIDSVVYYSAITLFSEHKIKVSKKYIVNIKNYENLEIYELGISSFFGVNQDKFPPFSQNKKLYCDACGSEITENIIRYPGAIITFEYEDHVETETEIIKNINFLHKFECAVRDNNNWREMSEFMIPELYLDILMTLVNLLNSENVRYDLSAKEKLFHFLFFMYPFVFRKSSLIEFEEFLDSKQALNFGY